MTFFTDHEALTPSLAVSARPSVVATGLLFDGLVPFLSHQGWIWHRFGIAVINGKKEFVVKAIYSK